MSRLIDKLTSMKKPEPRPIGFMVSKSTSEKPRMQLVALMSAENMDKVSAGLKYADATLIEISKSSDIDALDKACQTVDGAPSGGWIKASNAGTVKKFMNIQCDFLAFPTSAPLSVTQKDKMGRVLEMDASLNEGLLRTVNDLPVDAVLVVDNGDDSALTLNRLMFIQRIIYLTNKPVMVPVPGTLSGPDLQALWDMGVTGIVVEVTDEKSAEKLSDLREMLEKLNPPAFLKKARTSAILPRPQPEREEPREEEGGGEEEDE
jgi:hypothetical protein